MFKFCSTPQRPGEVAGLSELSCARQSQVTLSEMYYGHWLHVGDHDPKDNQKN